MEKRMRIIVDICMAVLTVLLFMTRHPAPVLHSILGIALIAAVIIHFVLNRKWLLSTMKNISTGKLNKKSRYMLFLVIGLTVAFLTAIISGIALYLSAYTSVAYQAGSIIKSLHGISGTVFILFGVLHVKVHWKYIKSKLGKKKRGDKS